MSVFGGYLSETRALLPVAGPEQWDGDVHSTTDWIKFCNPTHSASYSDERLIIPGIIIPGGRLTIIASKSKSKIFAEINT